MDISSAPSTTGSFPLDDRNEPVYLARDGHTAAIVLNRPEKLNAITRHMWMRLHEVITILSADTSLRCIVLRSGRAPYLASYPVSASHFFTESLKDT